MNWSLSEQSKSFVFMKNLSKNCKIARELAAFIRCGKISAGGKLPSVRKLMNTYNVSSKVISMALARLEKDGLIRRVRGAGIYVQMLDMNRCLEVILLIWNAENDLNRYEKTISGILNSTILSRSFNLTCRIAYMKCFDSSVIKCELERLQAMVALDVILLVGPRMSLELIKNITECGIPIIVVGDFLTQEMYPPIFFQISGDNYHMGYSLACQLVEMTHCKKASILTGDYDIYFYRESADGFRDAAKNLGLQLNIMRLKRKEIEGDLASIKSRLGRIYFELVSSEFKDAPFVDLIGQEQYIASYERRLLPNLYQVEIDQTSLTGFYHQIFTMVRFAVSHRSEYRRTICQLKHVLRKCAS